MWCQRVPLRRGRTRSRSCVRRRGPRRGGDPVQLESSRPHSLKAPGCNPETWNVISWFQSLLFQIQLAPLHRAFSRSPKVAALLAALGMKTPTPVQSMYIFKQPSIGGGDWVHDNKYPTPRVRGRPGSTGGGVRYYCTKYQESSSNLDHIRRTDAQP